MQAMWGRIKALRAASDVKEAALLALPLEALEIYPIAEGWPE